MKYAYKTVWVTDWATIPVTEEEIAEAGIWFKQLKGREKAYPRKNFAILHDLLTLYCRDDL